MNEGDGFIGISYVVALMVFGACVSSVPLVVLVDCFTASSHMVGVKYCGNLLFLCFLFPCVFFGVFAFVVAALYLGNHFLQEIAPNFGNTRRFSALGIVKLGLTAALFAGVSYYYETRIYAFSPVVARLYLIPFVIYSAVLFAFIPAHLVASVINRNGIDSIVQESEYEHV